MPKAFLRWLFVGAVMFIFTACGGGGGSSSPSNINIIDKNDTTINNIAKEDSQKSIISGYVVDDPIEKATIELQEINGTLIQRFESVTNADGSYSIKIDKKYKNKDFILRAYNGTMSNKAFDGDLYGYHLSGDDLEINLTPLNTVLLTLSSEFSDTDFSDRLAKAKDLLSATYGISEDEFSSIKDSDFSNFDIVKFRELVSSIGFNGLVQSLVADSIDGYADKNNSKLLFVSAKQRVLKDAKTNFAIVDTNLGSDEVSKLTIRGVSEKEDGTTGTMDMLTDVIVTKTDTDDNNVTKETIVFRSFNVGKWKGKLNEETTLLARIFMDYRLTNLTPSVQESIATKLLKERADDFQNAIKYQNMATDVPFAYPYYMELMEGLRVFALSYISNFSIAQTDKVGVTLSKFSKFVQHQRKYSIKKNNRISIGLLEVETTENALAFANYAKVNYGLRAYEIDGVKQDYDYPFWDFNINIIKPVKGGTIGGLYDYMRNKLKFIPGTTISYDNKLLGEDRLLNDISKVKLEMYKWQGSYPTLLNVADGFQIVGNTFNIFKGDISQKIKDKFKNVKLTYSKVKKYALYLDMAVESLNMVVDSYAWIAKQYQGTNKLENVFSKDFIKLKDSTNKAYTRVAGILKKVDTLINTEGYSIPNKIDAKKMKVNFGLKKVLLTDVPNYIYTDEKKVSMDNGFSTKISNFLKTIKYDKEKSFRLALKDKVRLLSKFNSIIVQGEIEKIIKEQIAQGKIEKGKSDIDNFNTKYGKYFSFKQMHYVISYIVLSKDKINASNIIRKKIAIRESTFSKAIADYSKIMLGYMGNGIKKVGTFDITGLLKASLKSTEGKSKDLEILKDMFSGAANIGQKDPTELFKASAKFMIETLDGNIKTAASNVLKNIMVNLFGGGYAKLGIAANDITSYVAGNFLTPNKQYLELNKDGDKVSIKRPPLTLVGLDSSHVSNIESYDISIEFHDIVKKYTNNFLNKKAINNSYLVTLDKDYSVSYVPHYDVIVSQTRASKFKDMLDNAIFLNNTFMKFDFNIEKSNNNKIDGSFEKNKKLSFENIVITVDNMKKVEVEKGENDLYSFNAMEAWGHKLGDFNKYVYMVLPNTQRGIFRESINLQFFQPKETQEEFIMPNDLYEKQQSRKNYIYLATTGKTLGKNLIIEKVVRNGYDWLRIENKNSFDIYFEVERDYTDNGLFHSDDREAFSIDYKVDRNSVYLFPMLGLKDNKGNYNDVEFNFYDGIAQDFFENNGFAEPRLSNYLAVNNKDSSLVKASEILTYNIKLDDITKTDKYLMIKNCEDIIQRDNRLSNKGDVKVIFNMPLSSDSLNKIKVCDVNEERYLNSDEYTVTHTSGNEYLITIKDYRNHHEYKLVFPNDLTSESGAKFLEEREIANFIYYNQKPIANAGADQTIKQGETVTLDASGSSDVEDDIDSLSFVWKEGDNKLGTNKVISLNNLSIGEHHITLTVTDTEGDSSSDELVLRINNQSTPVIIKKSNNSIIKKTGQTKSYKDYDDGYYEIGIDINYDKDKDNVLDRVTGFRWRDDKDVKNLKMNWEDAKNYCRKLSINWRLPTRAELSGLVRYDKYNPAIDDSFENSANDSYWTLDVSANDENKSWVVKFDNGNEYTSKHSNLHFVRCVDNSIKAVANAGLDMFIPQKQKVILDASKSPNKSLIKSYSWYDGSKLLGNQEILQIDNIKYGEHNIELRVVDKKTGKTNIDKLRVYIVSDNKEVKKTGQTKNYEDYDDGFYEMGAVRKYDVIANYENQIIEIIDKTTGLIWQNNNDKILRNWNEAKKYCEDISIGGYTKWRLPTRAELSSLVKYDTYKPATDSIFGYTANSGYWSIDNVKLNNHSRWIVNFEYGNESLASKTSKYYTRCVKSDILVVANAGLDMMVAENETIKLDASNTPNKFLVTKFTWKDVTNGLDKILGYGESLIETTIIEGQHLIELLTTDNQGIVESDTIYLNIVSDNKEVKKTGQRKNYKDYDDGFYEMGTVRKYKRFDDNTILDRATGILWQDNKEGNNSKLSWEEAKEYCHKLVINLNDDWRLPTREELSSLVLYSKYQPATDDIFKYIVSDKYWTLNANKRKSREAWVVDFKYGNEYSSSIDKKYNLRCISSQILPIANAGLDMLVREGTKVKLSAINSSRKELIDSYSWSEGGVELGKGIEINKNINRGIHLIELSIIDKKGRDNIDNLSVSVVFNGSKIKKTGQIKTYGDYDDGNLSLGYAISYSNSGGYIKDNVTKLVWSDSSNKKLSFSQAQEYCSDLGTQWRLPTRLELSTLVNYGKYNPAINDNYFGDTEDDYYWTQTISHIQGYSVYVIDFGYGSESIKKITTSNYTRCVKFN